MKESAREGLLVDGAGAPLAEEDSGRVELLDGTSVAYHAIAPENASALLPPPERAFDLPKVRSLWWVTRVFSTSS